MRTTRRVITTACALLLVFAPWAASAHTRFLMSAPAPDEVLAASPHTVQLHFSKPVEAEFSKIEVKDSQGKRIESGKVTRNSDNTKILEMSLPALPAGKYQVEWSVVSGDSHRVKGDFSFSVK